MTRLSLALSALLLGLGTAVTSAQRPAAATYDASRQIRLEGTVTRVEWVNPRAFLFINVTDRTGTVTNWGVEIGNPLELEARNWTRTAVAPGAAVRVDGIPARGAAPRVAATAIVLTRTGRAVYTPAPRAIAIALKRQAPRWPDGQVRLGPEPGKTGYWGAASANALIDGTAGRLGMTDEGLLTNLADVDRVAPFQPWSRALYAHRQRTLLIDDPIGRCMPTGGPRQFHTPHGIQFVEQRELGRILVLAGGGNRNWRVIHTDGRPLAPAAEVVLGYYGTSVGRWQDKDTLVVESTGYNERFWFTNGGLPHTEALRLTERFVRTDLQTLRYDVTVDDPRTYTRPWSGGWTISWVADRDMDEHFCEEHVE